ncbi:MAG TPA: hypothetical protein ENL15_03420 [Firmicutes bacterium]|nr:hypothetical protein [Bacillota bacterium]
MAEGFNLNDPKYQKILFGILAGIIAIIVFYFYVLGPQRQQIGDLKQKIEKEKMEVKRLVALSKKIPDLQAELDSKKEEIARISKSLPTKQEIPTLLRQITDASQQAGITLTYFNPGRLDAKGDYLEFKVDIQLEGTYHKVGYFLSQLSHLSRIINVGNLKITRLPTVDENTINVKLDLVAYVYNQTQGEKSGKGK